MKGKTLAVGTLVLCAAVAGMAPVLPASAGSDHMAQSVSGHRYNVLGESVGLVGYDPVSYFPEGGGKPQRGLIGISQEHDGVTYRFASEDHLARFKKNPEKYLPAYGGWCAWAAGELAKRVDVDPESFEVRDGRLYLFYRDPALDTRALWVKKPADLIAKANANWPALAQ